MVYFRLSGRPETWNKALAESRENSFAGILPTKIKAIEDKNSYRPNISPKIDSILVTTRFSI